MSLGHAVFFFKSRRDSLGVTAWLIDCYGVGRRESRRDSAFGLGGVSAGVPRGRGFDLEVFDRHPRRWPELPSEGLFNLKIAGGEKNFKIFLFAYNVSYLAWF